MIRIDDTRFGTVEIEDSAVIHFPSGLIGFPAENRFALLERASGGVVAYLQSIGTPGLSLPVMDGSRFGPSYPVPSVVELARAAGMEPEAVAVLVVVAAQGHPPRLFANLLAPILIDTGSRRASQLILDSRLYSASFPLGPQHRGPRTDPPLMTPEAPRSTLSQPAAR